MKPETILKKYIISKYVKGKFNYGLEMKQAGRLIKLFPVFNFWESMQVIELQSLTQLLTQRSLHFLQQEYNKFTLCQKSNIEELEINKIGEDSKIEFKPKNLKEFLQ